MAGKTPRYILLGENEMSYVLCINSEANGRNLKDTFKTNLLSPRYSETKFQKPILLTMRLSTFECAFSARYFIELWNVIL